MKTEDLGIYVHIPYCYSKCSYCDFNSYAMGGSGRRGRYAPAALRASVPDFIVALKEEIASLPATLDRMSREATSADEGAAEPRPGPGERSGQRPGDRRRFKVSSILFGGGTPTVLAPDDLSSLLASIRETVDPSQDIEIASNAEISLEANPESLAPCKHAPLRRAGFNRISIGVQSTDLKVLRALGRPHGASEAVAAVNQARAAGWESVSLDLIYGVPGQNPDSWRSTLERAVALAPHHISIYALSVHEGTPMGDRTSKRFSSLEAWEESVADDQARMYDLAVELLTAAGYGRYETSNFALPGHECRQNLNYWRPGAYVGFGPGAHSHLPGRTRLGEASVRWSNVTDVYDYLASPTIDSVDVVSAEKAMSEVVFLSLRTTRGLDLDSFAARFGAQFFDVYPRQWERLSAEGILEQKGRAVRLAPWTALVANQVLCEFV